MRGRADHVCVEEPNADAAMMELIAGRITADQALDEVVAVLHSTEEPDVDLIGSVGCGPLESIFHQGYDEQLWPRIEQLARDDVRFRRALSSVWADDSPTDERREALMEELGEYRNVTVRFVVEPRTFEERDGVDFRALDVEGMPRRPHLAAILRKIADRLDRPENKEPSPPPREPKRLTRPDTSDTPLDP